MSVRTVAAIAATALVVVMSAGCGGSAPPPAAKATSQASTDRPAQKTESAPAAPKASPTPDPAGRAEPDAGTCPESHQIKGATSPTGERLYYEPDRPSYPTITPQICFTAGGDARANGYTAGR